MQQNQAKYVEFVVEELEKKTNYNKTALEKKALAFDIVDKNQVKELTELAIVLRARFLAHQPNLTTEQRFKNIVDLYNSQVNLSHRTSQSMLLQQYSTPAPIGYLMGFFCGVNKKGNYFEPTAGNGLLTIAGNSEDFTVNEIDDFRNENLKTQGFKQVLKLDATNDFPFNKNGFFDAVIINPPFGKTATKTIWENYKSDSLEHVMVANSLKCMKPNGSAAIIIGGHTDWDSKGRIQAGKNLSFFSYLHKNFNVVDVMNISGQKLYSRQGTSFNVRLILIQGQVINLNAHAPLFNPLHDKTVTTFDELYNRVLLAKNNTKNNLELEAEALALELELLK